LLYELSRDLLMPSPVTACAAKIASDGINCDIENRILPLESGFTLIELMLVVAIIATLAAIAIPSYRSYLDKAKISRAIMEIKTLEQELTADELDGYLPASLAEIGRGNLKDPWGNPYQYQNFDLVPKGKWRKDGFLVPINTTFDLWSMGPDGKSQGPIRSKQSRDDIIRANDGAYVGPASGY
jgi:general secretion pathway protein G